MMNILELLKNEKVEWKKLGEVAVVGTGKSNTNEQEENGLYPFYVRSKTVKRINKYEFDEEAIIIPGEGGIGEIFHYVNGKYALHQRAYRIHLQERIIVKYVYYYMKTHFKEFITKNMVGSTVTSIRKPMIENFEIPIPSLETQGKIVEILDKFTNYVTELQSELQSRAKQYTYYRDMLLSEEYLNKVTKEMEEDQILKIVQLDEVIKIKNGKDWKELEEGDIPVYGSGGEMGVYVSKYAYDKPTVLIPRKGSIRNVFYMETPFWNVDTIFYTEIDESKLIPKYFYYFIEYFDLSKLSENSTRPSLTQSTLNGLKFPLPSLSLQNKIVKIIDKFQVMLADTKGLLPEEIAQRQKQYEYYREKLLTFETDCDSTHARTLILSNHYYDLLEEVSKFVEVDIEDKVKWLKLSDFCKRQKGISITAKQMQELDTQDGRVKVFAGGNTVAFLEENVVGNDNIIDKPSIIVKSRGNIDFEFYDNLFTHKNEMWSYSVNTGDDIKYVFYYLKSHVEYFKNKAISGKLPQISTGVTDNFKIPLPPLHVQQHIVSILDKFDTLVNDIKEGLPKEIEQRQKQYEYWREKLLSFNR